MNTKRIVSLLLLAAMLLALLCACGNKPADTTTPDNTGDTTTPAADTSDKTNDTDGNSDAEKPADDATEAPADNNAPQLDDAEVVAAGEGIEVDLETVELPLVDEPITLTAWRSYDPYGEWTDFNNSDWRKAVAEDTGVTVNFTTATAATAGEKFGLMLVSQDYTDLMMIPSLSALKSGDAAIEDEIVINLNDYDTSLYPHYYEFITSNSARWKGTHTDTGKLWGFFTILKEPEGGWTGPAYRSDLAADCGWTGGDPVTLQDWEDLLTCYRDGGIPVPLSFSYQGYYAYGMFASAFDTFPGLYAKNGTDVTYGFIDDGFKEYLTLMNKWYNEGLILSNFIDWDNDHSKQAAYGMKYDNIYWGDDVAAGMSVFSFTKRQLHRLLQVERERELLHPAGSGTRPDRGSDPAHRLHHHLCPDLPAGHRRYLREHGRRHPLLRLLLHQEGLSVRQLRHRGRDLQPRRERQPRLHRRPAGQRV